MISFSQLLSLLSNSLNEIPSQRMSEGRIVMFDKRYPFCGKETHGLSHVSETSNLVWKSVSPLTVGARGKLFFRAEFDVEYRWRVTYFVSKISRYILKRKEKKKIRICLEGR